MAEITNLKQFKEDLEKFNKEYKVSFERIVRLIALKIFTGVVKKTPVDTGVARASWVVGVGARPAPFIPERRTSKKGELGKAKTAPIVLRSSPINYHKIFDPIYISSYVPYMRFLEAGSSDKAPHGMMLITMHEVVSKFRGRTIR